MFNFKILNLFFYFSFLSIFIWLFVLDAFYYNLGTILIILTIYLNIVCVLVSVDSIKNNINYFLLLLMILFFILLVLFSTNNVLIFYVFFESSLIPMFLLVVGWGSRIEKSRAAYYLFFFTLISSILMLIGIIKLYLLTGSLNIAYLGSIFIPIYYQKWGFIVICLAFMTKIPMFPFHIWLPQAHVEAPLAGSVLLAGIMLKLGAYGFIKVAIPLYPYAFYYYSPFLLLLSLCSIVYGGLSTLRQSDMKRLIAYSSVAHMGFATYSLFNPNNVEMGIIACIIILIAHGFASPGLFCVVGIIYERYHTRIIRYYSGLGVVMPLLGVFAFLFTLSSIAFPGSLNFIGELLIIFVASEYSIFQAFIMCLGAFIGLLYSLYFYQRIFTGGLSKYLIEGREINKVEFTILLLLFFPIILSGIFPSIILNYI